MNILVAIEGCQAHRDRFTAIKETWANGYRHALPVERGNPVVAFLIGPMLNTPDDYFSLPAKTKAICRYSWHLGYDFTLIVDTDTYLSVPRALQSGFEQHDYSGFVLDYMPELPYCSGPSYWLSRQACEILSAADWPLYEVPGHKTDEDVMVGSVLRAHGIFPHHDSRYCRPDGKYVLPDNDVVSCHLSTGGPFSIEKMYAAHQKALGL